MLTAIDPKRQLTYTVKFHSEPDGSTTLVLGEANFGLRRTVTQANDFAPLFPGSEAVVRSNAETGSVISYSVQAPAQEVLKFYRKTLLERGFHWSTEDLEEGTFERGNTEIRVALNPGDGGRTGVVLLHQTRPE
jgi:hypothetical protein